MRQGREATPWIHGFVMLRAERTGVVANNPRLSRRVALGPEAASCLEWFDGTRSARDIAGLSRKRYGGRYADAERRVDDAMRALDSIAALATSRPASPRPPRMARPTRFPEGCSPAPSSAIWETTSACDLACAHCLADAGRRAPLELDTAGAIRVVGRLAEAGVLAVNLAGGEPFLRPDIFDIIDALVAARIEVDVSTNGFSLSDGTIRKLSRRPVYSVQVSVDGLRDEHDELRGRKGSFDAAVSSLSRLKAAGFRTSLSSVATRLNLGSIEAMAELASRLGCSSFKALPFLPAGRGAGAGEVLALRGPGLVAFARTILAIRERYAGAMGVFTESAMPFLLESECACACGGARPVASPAGDAPVGCSAGRDGIYIGSDGTAYPCPFFKDFALGSLVDSSLSDIWADAPFLGRLRRMTAADLDGACGDCERLGASCFGGCRAAAWLDTGDLFGADPICYRKALVP
ncbi:MAG: radical SAM protein [Spirochaetes bacterium]|nr:radical SAM protein [Spirochaetota bacterium]MBU1082410.1 radical SAM protein [Spirochaetota bacterium]